MMGSRLTVLVQASFLLLRDASQQAEGTDIEPIVICVWQVVMLKRVCSICPSGVCHNELCLIHHKPLVVNAVIDGVLKHVLYSSKGDGPT